MIWSADVCSTFYANWVKAIKTSTMLEEYVDIVDTGHHELEKALVLFRPELEALISRVLHESPLFAGTGNAKDGKNSRTAKHLVRILYEGFRLDTRSSACKVQVLGTRNIPALRRWPLQTDEQHWVWLDIMGPLRAGSLQETAPSKRHWDTFWALASAEKLHDRIFAQGAHLHCVQDPGEVHPFAPAALHSLAANWSINSVF